MFEKFRNNSLKNYGLCPRHCLSWDTVLKMKKTELKLISHLDMYILFEKGTKGAIFYVSNRHSKANNKYLKSCDLKEESKHIIYLDANNLYDYSMS